MNNELITQGQIFNFQGMDFTVILIEDKPYWIAKEICDYLELSNPSVALQNLKEDTQKKFVDGDKLRMLKKDTKLNLGCSARLNLLTEAGVYKLVFKSRKPNAEDFTDWISEEVLPTIRNTGKFDVIENKIKQIKDETERNLTMSLYGLKQVLKVNPNDMLTVINYNQTKTELDNYKNKKELAKQNEEINRLKNNIDDIKNDTELIKKQQVFICNRTNFNERVKILANKYFGRDIQQAYQKLFSTMRLLGSFDVSAHRKHEWEAINAERSKNGKKPYKTSTLKQKVNYLDVIDKFNKWELCSEAYKTIETEMVA